MIFTMSKTNLLRVFAYRGFPTRMVYLDKDIESRYSILVGNTGYISRVSDLNCVSQLYIILEIHHSGRKPSIKKCLNIIMLLFRASLTTL